MATISPFMAIRPQSVYADKMLSFQSSANGPAGKIEKSLDYDLTGNTKVSSAQFLDNFRKMVFSGDLYREDQPGIFIYEITDHNVVQTGIWTLTDLRDHDKGMIKTHEAALHYDPENLIRYRAEVGLEGAPVLLAHRPSQAIKSLLYRQRQQEVDCVYLSNKVFHRIWAIHDLQVIRQFSKLFAELQSVYLVDGHHRMEAALNYRKIRGRESDADCPYNYISTLYMSSEQLRIKEYHRMVLPYKSVEMDYVFRELKRKFSVTRSIRNVPVIPYKKSDFGMCMGGRWYNLMYKQKDGGRIQDPALLQDQVLRPLFKIEDPCRDPNLISVGGGNALELLQEQLELNPLAVGFTLTAMNADQIMEVAQQQILLPPKSTWVEPKVPFGILLRKID